MSFVCSSLMRLPKHSFFAFVVLPQIKSNGREHGFVCDSASNNSSVVKFAELFHFPAEAVKTNMSNAKEDGGAKVGRDCEIFGETNPLLDFSV